MKDHAREVYKIDPIGYNGSNKSGKRDPNMIRTMATENIEAFTAYAEELAEAMAEQKFREEMPYVQSVSRKIEAFVDNMTVQPTLDSNLIIATVENDEVIAAMDRSGDVYEAAAGGKTVKVSRMFDEPANSRDFMYVGNVEDF